MSIPFKINNGRQTAKTCLIIPIDKTDGYVIEYIKRAQSLRKGDGMDKRERLIGLYTRVYSRPKGVALLKLLGAVSVAYVVLAFTTVNLGLLLDGKYAECARLCAVSAIPFAAVSAMRFVLNAPRPYEAVDFVPFALLRQERKSGRSFPSRHVFSAFLIGTLALSYSVPLGVITLLVGAIIALTRVLLGIHFTRDALVGGIIGVLSGVIGMLFL